MPYHDVKNISLMMIPGPSFEIFESVLSKSDTKLYFLLHVKQPNIYSWLHVLPGGGGRRRRCRLLVASAVVRVSDSDTKKMPGMSPRPQPVPGGLGHGASARRLRACRTLGTGDSETVTVAHLAAAAWLARQA